MFCIHGFENVDGIRKANLDECDGLAISGGRLFNCFNIFTVLKMCNKILLEVIGNSLLQAERIISRLRAAAYLLVAFGPFVAILLSDERIAEVEEHPGHADDAVDAADGLADKESNTHTLDKQILSFEIKSGRKRFHFKWMGTLKMGEIRHMSMTFEPRNWPRQA